MRSQQLVYPLRKFQALAGEVGADELGSKQHIAVQGPGPHIYIGVVLRHLSVVTVNFARHLVFGGLVKSRDK